MSPQPELWIIGGPNGAGKTTLAQRQPIRQLLPQILLLNPDDLTRARIEQQGFATFAETPESVLREEFIRSADVVLTEAAERLRRNEAVAIETVLSTDKYRPVVEEVRSRSGFFGLIYVALRSADLSNARVERRVAQGGHHVSPDRVAARWHRSLAQLPWFVQRANCCFVFDNSDENPANPPRLIAESLAGRVVIHEPKAIPELSEALRLVVPF